MAKLERTKSGLWTARKVIPADVREAYGKREEKPTWPASLTQGQARAEFAAWLMQVEERITALRSVAGGPEVDLTARQCRALAGRWYEGLSDQFADNPGDAAGWEASAEELWPEDSEEAHRAYRMGDVQPYDGPWRITPWLQSEHDALLAGEGLKVTRWASERLLQDMATLYLTFCDLMERRARGDYGADLMAATLPAWESPQAEKANQPGAEQPIMALFDAYVAERKPADATVKAWKRMLQHLVDFLGHDAGERVTADDIVNWKDNLATTPTKAGKLRSAKTVGETYLAAVKAVFGYAKDNRKIATDPTRGIRVRGAKPQKLRDPGFSNSEAELILRATLEPAPERMSVGNALARRWVPWVCAYTGARVNEITQLRKGDVIHEDGVWAINITPEAGSTKNNAARKVPLHSHLIEQGFLEVVRKADEGPLFYDPRGHRGGSAGNPQYKKVGERLASWVRELGVSDPNVAPNHGWRHRFKTVARGAKVDPEARAVIPGHAAKTEGEAYGTWTLPDLADEIEKLPRYQVSAD